MNFTTKIPIQKAKHQINYSSKIVSLGSCFAENMAEKLTYFKFQNLVNPFGIIFNPISIEKLIQRAVNKKEFTEKDVFFHNDLWHCYEVHSQLSATSNDLLLTELNHLVHQFRIQLEEATHIIITYGTSWIYQLKSTNEIVANCHKVPQNHFDKHILSVESIEKSIQNTIEFIRKVNPNATVIFTVSPVRHIKDGFIENQRSKAHLITAIHSANRQEPATSNYFPSYEIMMDELRDYRFYADDMLHPNQTAINYIWERFFTTQVSEDCYPVMENVCSIQKAILHRPFNPNSESHQQFLHQLNQKISQLQEKHPFFDFS
jgi:hypothetical protein